MITKEEQIIVDNITKRMAELTGERKIHLENADTLALKLNKQERNKIYAKRNYLLKKEKLKAIMLAYRQRPEIKEKLRLRSKQHYKDNPEIRKAYIARGGEALKQKEKKTRSEDYQKNKEAYITRQKIWNSNNKEKIQAYREGRKELVKKQRKERMEKDGDAIRAKRREDYKNKKK